ncbi:MAG: hypothetical protein OHK0039_25360 [Bacteroidia bacterium]
MQDSIASAETYAQDALVEALMLKDPYRTAQAYEILGRVYHVRGRYILATDCFETGFMNVRDNEEAAKIKIQLINSLGVLYSKRGKYEKALTHFLDARQYWELLGRQEFVAHLNNNICALYLELKDHGKCISTAQDVLRIADALGPQADPIRAVACTNLGTAYEGLALYDTALKFHQMGLEIKQKQENREAYVYSLANIFSVYWKKGSIDQAKAYYQRAMAIADEENSDYLRQQLFQMYGDFLLQQNDYDEALDSYQKSLRLATFLQAQSSQMDLHRKIAYTYARKGDYGPAFRHHVSYSNLRDSLFSDESDRRMQELELLHNLRDKEKTIRELQQKEENARLRAIALLVLSACFIFALIAVSSRYRLRRRTISLLEQKHHEIESKNRELETKHLQIESQNRLLAERGEEIRKQNLQLAQSNRDLEQFASKASHDLQQPLRTVKGHIQLLQRRYGTQIDPAGHDFVNYALEGIDQMLRIVQDLLVFSRVGRERLQPEQVALDAIITRVRTNLAQQIADSGAEILAAPLPHMHGFDSELYILFQNLISNSIKFQRPNVAPRISIEIAARDAHAITLSVRDNGTGVSPAFLQKAFTMFERYHNRQQYEGTGIGLATCRKVMEHHDGSIWMESVEGEGTTVFLRFPAFRMR